MNKIIVFALLCLAFALPAFAADYIVIVNKANPVSSLSQQELQNIFLGKKTTWDDGKKIAPVSQEGTPVHDAFANKSMSKTAHQLSNYWKKTIFTGVGMPPKNVSNDETVKQYVANNRDAIGYISAGALDASVKKIAVK